MPNPERLQRWLRGLHRLEDGLLAGLLLGSLFLALLQIVLRSFFDTGLDWIGPLLRILMVWLGLWAGMIAARQGRHITMDALSPYLSPVWKLRLRRLTDAFSFAVCLLLAWASTQLVRMSHSFADTGPMGWPLWIFQIILPLGFSVMALRYLGHALLGWEAPPGPQWERVGKQPGVQRGRT